MSNKEALEYLQNARDLINEAEDLAERDVSQTEIKNLNQFAIDCIDGLRSDIYNSE